MHTTPFIDVIYTHTEGEPTCIVHSGIFYPPGSSLLEKRTFLQEQYDWLRRGLMCEPRGHHHMFGVFLTPPSTDEFDAGMLWFDSHRFVEMCGHGTIALSMAIVSHNLIPSCRERGEIRYETPAGPVTAYVTRDGDIITETKFQNVPAFVAALDVTVDVPGYGQHYVDVAFGGNFFGILKWTDPDLRIGPETGSQFAALGQAIKPQINEKLSVQHPEEAHINQVNFVTFWHEPTFEDSFYRNVHTFSDGKCDRSPGGTGTSAMMAMFEARGELSLNQKIRSEGLLGSGQFEGELIGRTQVGNHEAVIPTVAGTAYITGYAKWLFDPNDPLREGFSIR